ncbi:hypothetical protein PVAP13_5KG562200 [Panicum virgatum]|uniref:Cathepsin propeptide inhibitor domain-containing protein n=1 Tax=Panicum virgatum TaxID=38727 RepID=A0A8T0SV12_PANVG|nr:hypothetical protein PVAP13_5KG562200 [Panicum virgatum]
MGRGSMAALAAAAAAAAAALLVSLPMLLLLPPAADTYEQESRRMFVEWKAKHRKTYSYAGEEECRYALFKDSRRRIARARAAGVTSVGLNGLSARADEEIQRGYRVRTGEGSYEQETRRMFVGWNRGSPNTERPTVTSVRRSASTSCSRATDASSSGSTPPPQAKTCTASTNLATSPTKRSANAATRRQKTES